MSGFFSLYPPLPRYSLKKDYHLVHKRLIDDLFAHGKGITGYPIRVQIGQYPKYKGIHHQVAFSVPKRHWKRAVDRNRIKRLMREVYRHHHHALTDPYLAGPDMLVVFLIYVGKELPDLAQVEKGWQKIVKKWLAAQA